MASSPQQENFTFSNPTQISNPNLPEFDFNSWGSQNKQGNKQEMVNFARYIKEDKYELSLRDIVVEFPTILSYIKESNMQKPEKREFEKIKTRRNDKSKKSKWFLLKILFPLPSKKNGKIGHNSSIISHNLSINLGENFDLWEDNLFSDTSRSSSSSSSSSNISSDDQNSHDKRKMNGCFPFFNLAREAKS